MGAVPSPPSVASASLDYYIHFMQIIRSIKKMQAAARLYAARGKKIAIVPTMGALHEGHQSLVARAAKEADVVITTVFVNPAQFAPTEDLAKYPRDEKNDLLKIEAALGKKKASARARDMVREKSRRSDKERRPEAEAARAGASRVCTTTTRAPSGSETEFAVAASTKRTSSCRLARERKAPSRLRVKRP